MVVTDLEFRVQQIRDGQVIAFVPTDANGKRRDGNVWGIEENDSAGQAAKNWLPTDRIFFYHDVLGAACEAGYFNNRTKEKVRV
jgi:hypothetical protein